MLDGLAARLAAERAANDVLEVLAALINKMEKCVRQHDADGWLVHHGAFHEEIFKASRNSRLIGLMANIRLSIQRFHPLLLSTQDRLKKAFQEHDEIFHAIRSHDPNAAERLARRHIASATDIIIKLSQDERRIETSVAKRDPKSFGGTRGKRKRQ